MADEQEVIVELSDEEVKVEKQKIVDAINTPPADEADIPLPSEGEKKYANVYETVEDLKKGITNLKSTLPEYVINGMSDEALEQHYVELRKDFSSTPKEDAPEPKEDEPKPKEDEAKDVIDDPKLWAELDAEFTAKGGLTDEHYDKLKKMGIPSPVVDKYLDGLRSEATLFTGKVYELAGGEEQYGDIKAWAEENYSQDKLDMIASGSREEVLFKMTTVKAEYDKANAGQPERMFGSNTQGGTGYTSQADYIRDVASPEYRKNAKYKAKVEAKFKASSFAS